MDCWPGLLVTPHPMRCLSTLLAFACCCSSSMCSLSVYILKGIGRKNASSYYYYLSWGNAKETSMAGVPHDLLGRKRTIVHAEAFEFGIQVLMVNWMGGAANEETRRERLSGGFVWVALARAHLFAVAVCFDGGSRTVVGHSDGVPFWGGAGEKKGQ